MVFSSVPSYLDQPNWHQQPNNLTSAANTQLLPPPPPQGGGGGGGGSIRPGSMADRARLANIPIPETAQKCPRCESTNTKFCYFNNYSLSQPRHFCKTCRRYWTRGGALRNVPVGGGCRRNKRSAKNAGSASKSPARPTGSGSSATVSSSSGASDALGLAGPQIPPLRFFSPLNHLSEFGNDQIGLNYGSLSAPIGGASDLNFQLGHVLAGSGGSGSGGLEQWRLNQSQQFPLFGGLDIAAASSGSYPFEGGAAAGVDQLRAKMSSSLSTQMASVKMEDNNQAGMINLSRQFVGLQGNGNQFWSGNANWTDLSNFSYSSTTNPL